MIKKILRYSLAFLVFYALAFAGIYQLYNDNLPELDELENFQPKQITKVFSADGKHLQDFLEENREILTYEEIPQAMKNALLSIEDRRFFSHWGIDIHRIFGAILGNVKSLNPTAQGASTLTQQLARNLFEKVGRQSGSSSLEATMASYGRKIREQITAVNIERLYTKREILTMYLNTVFFGYDRYGLKSAARYYFDRDVKDLKVEECAMLAGLLKAPNTYNPRQNPEKAIRRRNQVLQAMAEAGKLPSRSYKALQKQPILTRRGQRAETYGLAPYFIEYVRQILIRQYGSGIYRDGFTVHTTLDSRLQQIAEKHFDKEIGIVQERVDKFLAKQDSAAGLPASAQVQAAFVAMDPQTGHILAMIGGRDFSESQFNRSTQALRLPGSSFKPFVYTAAIDNNRFAIDIFDDNAITIREYNGEIWDPENYDKTFLGPLTLRESLKRSRNLIAIKLAQEIGPQRIKGYAQTMGIRTPVQPVTSIAIGTSAVRLLELVSAYAVFPNKGIYVEPAAVDHITDKEGNTIFAQKTIRREVLRPAVAVIMTDLMRSVTDEPGGTGYKIRTRYGFRPTAAGKTGTTNDYADAWFIGFTPHLVAGVWVGMDDPSLSLWKRQSGAVAALPLWVRFMKEVYRKVEPYRSRARETFDYPENLVTKRAVCEDSHKLATKYCPHRDDDLFINEGAQPSFCPLHGGDKKGAPGSRLQRF